MSPPELSGGFGEDFLKHGSPCGDDSLRTSTEVAHCAAVLSGVSNNSNGIHSSSVSRSARRPECRLTARRAGGAGIDPKSLPHKRKCHSGQEPFAGTARRVLCTKGSGPLFPAQRIGVGLGSVQGGQPLLDTVLIAARTLDQAVSVEEAEAVAGDVRVFPGRGESPPRSGGTTRSESLRTTFLRCRQSFRWKLESIIRGDVFP